MILSNSLKFIFVHLHKTAGTSITSALEPTFRWNDIVCGSTDFGEKIDALYREQYGMHKHSTAEEIRNIVGEEVWKDYYTFTFVRNPYYRTISNYTYIKMLVKKQGIKRLFRRFDKKRKIWTWATTKAYLATNNFSEFIRHKEFMNNAKAGICMCESLSNGERLIVDYIGKVENIKEDFQHICRTIKRTDLQIGKRNVSKKKVNLEAFYQNQADLDHVYELYRKDFDSFGYKRIIKR
jgi:hypothetical protein